MASFKEKYIGRSIGIGLLILVVGAAAATYFVSPQVRDQVASWYSGTAKADEVAAPKAAPAELIALDNGRVGGKEFGLKLSKEAIESLELKPTEALLADQKLPLPPMIGTVNYDNDRLFTIRPRFQGEVADILEVEYADYPQGPKKKRPLRFGDHVKQGETLAVLWCRELGEKKAALVDSILSLHLSLNSLESQSKTFDQAALSLATLRLTERQVQSDMNAYRTAERTLKMWKLTDKEIQDIVEEARASIDRKLDIKDQAKKLLERKLASNNDATRLSDPTQVRDAETEKNWRVPVLVPALLADPTKKLVVVEKNTNRNDMVDPTRDTPLFRVADLSRLQIWVHPPEEYLPFLLERLKEGPGALKWEIRFQSDAANTPAKMLEVAMISPSLEPNQHTPMLIGYLDNSEEKHLIGQFVTATIHVSAPLDENKKPVAVQIPTEAINQLQGQNLVFVQNPDAKDEFMLRRVAVVQSSKKTSLVRLKLTGEDQDTSNIEVKKGRYPIQPLAPGERVITRGVVELTNALEDIRSQQKQAEK